MSTDAVFVGLHLKRDGAEELFAGYPLQTLPAIGHTLKLKLNRKGSQASGTHVWRVTGIQHESSGIHVFCSWERAG